MAHDSLHRYLFDKVSVRGELVQLADSYSELTAGKAYPDVIKKLLGELMVATSLLTATLKFNGSITVQIQGDGPVSLVVINGNNEQQLKGTVRWEESVPQSDNLRDLIGNGQIVITIEPEQGERYQGIVGLERESLQACLEEYFTRSEQLTTRLWLRAGEYQGKPMAAGMLLQILPSEQQNDADFDHLAQLTETVKNEELFGLDAKDVLYRLYHQENVTLYEPSAISFKCSCSREKSAAAITALPRSEVESMLDQDQGITLHCDYCGSDYHFDKFDIAALFDGDASAAKQLH